MIRSGFFSGALLAALTAGACYHGTNDVPLATGGSSSASSGSLATNASSASSSIGGAASTSVGSGGSSSSTGGAASSSAASTSSSSSSSGGSTTGVFVVVGYGARRLRSTDDGVTWTDDTALEPDGGGDDDYLLRAVTWGTPGFVALGWRSMTSTDGSSWTDHGANIGQWLGGVVYVQNQFVAVGGYGMRAVSADGVTWTNHSIDTIATHAGDGIVYGDVMGGRFVSANDDGQRSYSPDGVTWTYATSLTGTLTTHLAFGNGVFLGIGGAATDGGLAGTSVVTSTDGETWTLGASLGASVQGLVYANGQFTAVASGHVYTSTNGAAWTDHAATGLNGGPIAYGHGTYVMVDGNGAIQRSTDGLTWQAPVESGVNALQWVAFGPVQ